MIERDEWLGRELRALDVPAHGPEFFSRLAERLEQEPARDRPPRRRPVWQRPPMLMAFAAAAVVVVLVTMSTVFTDNGGNPIRPGPSEPVLISATEVRSRVSTALSSLRSLSGEVTIDRMTCFNRCNPSIDGARVTQQWSFVTTAAGDERVTAIGGRADLALSASLREQRSVFEGGRPATAVLSNLAAGPPDLAGGSPVLRKDVASVVRAFLATTDDVPVTDVTEQGRPAWRLVTPVVPNKLAGPGASADVLEVLVDRQSGFPLRVTETIEGRFLRETRLSKLVVDGPVDPASFVLELPAGEQPVRQDVGFRSVALGQVAAAVGYVPLLPSRASLPPGYELAEVTVAPVGRSTGSEGGNPQSRNVVSVAYGRGFDRIVVSTRSGTGPICSRTPPYPTPCWADPLASGEGFLDQPERYTIGGGALAGAQAELLISPRGTPHVWTIHNGLVVTVAGDASADELRRLAASFAPAG